LVERKVVQLPIFLAKIKMAILRFFAQIWSFQPGTPQAAVDLGFSKEDILNSLSGRKPTKHAATYYLLVEKMSGNLPRLWLNV